MKTLYESILDADLDTMTNNVNDIEQISAIKAYIKSRFWDITKPGTSFYGKITYKYGHDDKGYYIETEGTITVGVRGSVDYDSPMRYFHDNIDWYNRVDKKNCPKFYWKSHKGSIIIPENCQKFSSIKGLPEEIDKLVLCEGIYAPFIDLSGHKISKINLINLGKIKLMGDSKTKVEEIEWSRGWAGYKPILIGFSCKQMHQEPSRYFN